MALEIGKYDAEIVGHTIRMLGDKPAVVVDCSVGGEVINVPIWLTEKAAGIARRSLKLCGFDPDVTDMEKLDTDPLFLSGNHVTIIVDEWNGKVRGQIMLDVKPKASEIKRLQAAIRSAKYEDGPAIQAPTTKREVPRGPTGSDDPDDIPF